MSSESRWIEIVGIAGAGKSTLTRALAQRYPRCTVADSLHTRVAAHWPYVAHSLPRVLPLLARTARQRPMLSWEELKFVVYVSEWTRYLRSRPEHRSVVTVLDQGPIFALARLLWSGKPVTSSEWFQSWLSEMVGRWSLELDAIVVLQAPDEVLLERINRRDRLHDVKGKSTSDALRLLESHRSAYTRVLDAFDRREGPRALRFDSSRMPAEAIAEELANLFEVGPAQRVDGSVADRHPEDGENTGARARVTSKYGTWGRLW